MSAPAVLALAASPTLLDAVLVAVADVVHARSDARARQAGWTVTRAGRTGRTYHDPALDELAARRAARTCRTGFVPSVIA